MNNKLQLDFHHYTQWWHHLEYANEVKMAVWFAGKNVWSIPEYLESGVLAITFYINMSLPFAFYVSAIVEKSSLMN